MKLISAFFFFLSITIMGLSSGASQRANIWPTIPFIRGADLCAYKDTYSQARSEYLQSMVQAATRLMGDGAYGAEALKMLISFNALYERNLAYATRGNGLDITLESSLKSYVDLTYRNLRPLKQNISFQHLTPMLEVIRSAGQGQRDSSVDLKRLNELDYMAYGTYSLAPNCQGDVFVTLHLIGKNSQSISFMASGRLESVMSKITSQLFETFQRTRFPSTLKIGKSNLTLIGGLMGDISTAKNPTIAELSCQTLNARLPSEMEYNLIDSYGSWSGGVSLDGHTWAMSSGNVFAPHLRNPTPVRQFWEVNDQEILYFCVQ
ncbi:MAG: hypothetical protein LW875_02800 [Proteobacteria bacterium]|nr:hypothetical protein [Pseudomonadota bacterium]